MVTAGHGAEKMGSESGADNTKSPVASKNDMGGTSANIVKGGEETGGKPGDWATGAAPKADTTNYANRGGSGKVKPMPAPGNGHGAEKMGSDTGSDKSAKSPVAKA